MWDVSIIEGGRLLSSENQLHFSCLKIWHRITGIDSAYACGWGISRIDMRSVFIRDGASIKYVHTYNHFGI